MSTNSNNFEIGLLKAQGGKISYELFYQLVDQLQNTRSLDYVNPQLLASRPANLGKSDVVYILLCYGYKPDLGQDGYCLYAHTTGEDQRTYWLAGFACLLFPTSRSRRDGRIIQELGDSTSSPSETPDISIALLPAAQKQGHGRFLVQKLTHHAFNILRILRVTASVVCPVRPSHSAIAKKQVTYNSKQLCWIFEKFGFMFEGITRGAVMGTSTSEGEGSMWHDIYRLSMLYTDCVWQESSHFFSHTLYSMRTAPQNPWESMVQRQEEEKRNVKYWNEKARDVSVNDACVNDSGDNDDDTVSGSDFGSDRNCGMVSSSQAISIGNSKTGKDRYSKVRSIGLSPKKLRGKRRARAPPPPSAPETREEDSLSDRDADWEPEGAEVDTPPPESSAPKFVRLESVELDNRSHRGQGSPGPSTSHGARSTTSLPHQRAPRTRASGKEIFPGDYDLLPSEASSFTCNWIPLEFPGREPCQENYNRLSDLRRHQRPHFEVDLTYSKEQLDAEAVARAQAAIDKCAGRGQSYACEFCGKIYTRLDAVARHRQQPQGRQCNIAYKRLRAEERARAMSTGNQAET